MPEKTVFIACAAGFADERADPARALVRALALAPGPRYIVYETLGERTLALAQLDRRANPGRGYTPRLELFLRPILADCIANNIRIIGNFGAANPHGAAAVIRHLAEQLNLPGVKVAVIEGDNLLARFSAEEIRAMPMIEGISFGDREIIAANAYLGSECIAEALRGGANVVVCGRCTDSALTLGPLLHEHGWETDDWQRLASGILAGHLLECSAQVTGGYFADPGYKDVPNVTDIGYPLAEVTAAGQFVITKPAGTGGLVSAATVKEQLLYEIQDPANYLTPDVVLDITEVTVEEIAPNRVRVSGAHGKPRPQTLKATVSVDGGWLAEGEISYGGPNALARAELAARILAERLDYLGIRVPTRIDILGTISTFDSDNSVLRSRGTFVADGDYRVRLAANSRDKQIAEQIVQEVIGLYNTGPGGGGGVRKALTSRVSTGSILVDRDLVPVRVVFTVTGAS